MPGQFLDLSNLLLLCVQIFFIGMVGLISSQNNIIFVIISLEMMLLAASLAFIFCSTQMDSIHGQIFALFILTIAAAESAIGLAMIVAFYRLRSSTNLEMINLLKG